MATFKQTIHHVNFQHYSQKQLDAWTPAVFDNTLWSNKLAKHSSFVCVKGEKIVGYSDLQPSGYIDHFFCHHLFQGQVMGAGLMAHIYTLAEKQNVTQLSTEVSITAKSFFEVNGFEILKQRSVPIRGQVLINFKMIKML